MKKAIVTGANGFIGSWLVRELLANDVIVLALVHNKADNLPKHENLSVHTFSLDKADELAYDFGGDVDVFYHLAWQGSSGEGRSNPVLQHSNIKWAIDALHLAKKIGVKRFVGAGSLMEKEVQYDVPKKNSKPSSVSVYGAAKLSAHYFTKTIAASLGIDHLWSYISAYGVGDNHNRFVCSTIKKMLENNEPLKFTKADQCYDFCYVTDTAKALRLIGVAGHPFSAYNIGSGKPGKLRDYIEQMQKIVNPDCVLEFGAYDYKAVYLPEEEFDTYDLLKDTGFECETSFCEGVEKTMSWLKHKV